MSELDSVVKEFLVESYENLDQLDSDLVTLEKNPTDREVLASIFRTIHTIKGTCGFLAFSKLEALAHSGESLLGLLRDGKLLLNSEIASALLSMVDAIRQILSSIETTDQEGEGDYSALTAHLKALQEGSPVAGPPPGSSSPDGGSDPDDRLGQILVRSGTAEPADVEQAVEQQQDGDPRPIGEILVDQGTIPPKEVINALNVQEENRGHAVAESTIRVDVGVLDKLMNLVGELVLARNQILQYTTTQNDNNFSSTSQRLNLITTELQEGVMKTRMQPIGNIWSKFPRVVRDLARNCNKKIRIEMEGEETELDKTIIEAMKDPLTHMVRNSVDHGIESPEVRAAAGKRQEGLLLLRAFHEGGQVIIEICDDGAGIDREKVRHKAVEKGLISQERASRLSDREQLNLVCLPGFSTAEKVTNVSGRGVGMDVVKTQVEKIGGTVDLQSTPGHGTTVRIKIPLTLAIIPALIVSSCGDRYAIPQVSLRKLVLLEGEQARKGIETIQGTAVYRLRGNLLPLVDLRGELGLKEESTGQDGRDLLNIVVLQADGRQFGLIVDEIQDTEEIVVKPLSQQMKGISTYAGATIMGDGRVALILDVLGLAQRAHVVTEAREQGQGDAASDAQHQTDTRQSVLLFEVEGGGRMAIPLSSVARLEEFPRSSLESFGGQDVVQYRGDILPLVHATSLSSGGCSAGSNQEAQEASGERQIQVVVCAQGDNEVGLVVRNISDVVEDSLANVRSSSRRGIKGSQVLQGRVTEIIDVQALYQEVDSAMLEQPELLAS